MSRIRWEDIPEHHVLTEQPKGTVGVALQVTLLSTDNQYLQCPCRGVLRITETGVDFQIVTAQFMRLSEHGEPMGAFVEVARPAFTVGGPFPLCSCGYKAGHPGLCQGLF